MDSIHRRCFDRSMLRHDLLEENHHYVYSENNYLSLVCAGSTHSDRRHLEYSQPDGEPGSNAKSYDHDACNSIDPNHYALRNFVAEKGNPFT